MTYWQDPIHRVLDAQAPIIAMAGQIDEVFEAAVKAALVAMPRATGAVIEMVDGKALVYRAASGGVLPGLVGLRLPLEGSFSGACLLSDEALLCLDSETDPRVDLDTCRASDARAMVVAPIPFQGRNVGVLKVSAAVPGAFDEDDVLIARLLVAPIACGIANAAQAELARKHDHLARRFEATFDQAAVGMIHVAPSGRFLRVNARFCEVTGRSADELYHSTFQDITHPEDLDADLELFGELGMGKIDHYQMEKRYIRPSGAVVWINLTVSMVARADGTPDFFVAVVEDISQRREAEKLALRDALTGLPNRRAMLQRLAMAVKALPEASRSLAVAYLDLDDFKQVNDRLGHAMGDRCLVEVSRAINGAIRQDDTLYRIAGDEFLLLLPGAGPEEVERVLRRLGEVIAHKVQGTGWDIGVSAGAVVLHPGLSTHAEDVIDAADRLMYEIKQVSRNQPSGPTIMKRHLVRRFEEIGGGAMLH